MKNTLKYALTALIMAAAPVVSAADCVKVSSVVTQAVAADSAKVLEIVAKEIAANESCSCEVVKAAIIASEADKKTVAQIVDAAIVASPKNFRVIAQCAIAVAPDAVANVQSVVEKYERAGGGDYYVDSSKGAIDPPGKPPVSGKNPLDFPSLGGPDEVGPRPGGQGGFSLLPPIFPTFPAVVAPPTVTSF